MGVRNTEPIISKNIISVKKDLSAIEYVLEPMLLPFDLKIANT